MNKHKSNKIKENSNTVRHLIMGQITTTQNLVAIKEVRHPGQQGKPCPCVFCDHTTGGQCPKNTCCMRSQSHERLWPPLLKLKFGNGWLTSNCCSSHCKKKFNSGFSIPIPIPIPGFSIPIPFSLPPISIPIPIPELELELSCNSNFGIELTPTLNVRH